MPKMKSKRAAMKRFRALGSGRFKYRKTNARHNMSNKSRKRLRTLGGPGIVKEVDQKHVEMMLPYGT
jgi:large subunit ribosomal protein L35